MKRIISILICVVLLGALICISPVNVAAASYEVSFATPPGETALPGNKGCYNVGDTIDVTITGTNTFNSSGLSTDNASVATVEWINDKTIRITCIGNGLTNVKAGHTGGTANLYVLVGYKYPQQFKPSGYLYEFPSSARAYYSFDFISNGMYRSGANKTLTTIAGLNDQYVVQRFDNEYQVNDIQLFFNTYSTVTVLPTNISIDLCAEPFPNGYEQNSKVGSNPDKGDLTDYYTFSAGVNFNGQTNDGIIKSSFESKVNSWSWKRIYEKTAGSLTQVGTTTYYYTTISKADIIQYMADNGISRTGYFIRLSFSRNDLSSTQNFTLAQFVINVARTSELDIPAFTLNNPNSEVIADVDKTISYNVFSNEENPNAELKYRVWNDDKNAYGEIKTISANVEDKNTSPLLVPGSHSKEHAVTAVIGGDDITGSKIEYWIKFGVYESKKTEYDGVKLIDSINIEQNRLEIPRNASEFSYFSALAVKGDYPTEPAIKWKEVDATGRLLTTGSKLNLEANLDGTLSVDVKDDVSLDLNTYKTLGYGAIAYVSAFAGGRQSAPAPVWILPDVLDDTISVIASPSDITLLNSESITAARSMPVFLSLSKGQTPLKIVYKDDIAIETEGSSFVIQEVGYSITNDDDLLEIIRDAQNPFTVSIRIKDGVPPEAVIPEAFLIVAVTDIEGTIKTVTCNINMVNQLTSEDLDDITITRDSDISVPALYNGDGSFETMKVIATGLIRNVNFTLSEEDKNDFEIFDIIGPDSDGIVTAKIRAIGSKPKASAEVTVNSILPGVSSTTNFSVSYKTEPKVALYEYEGSTELSQFLFGLGSKKILWGKIYPSYAKSPDTDYDTYEFLSEFGEGWFDVIADSSDNIDFENLNSEEVGEKFFVVTGKHTGLGNFSITSTGSKYNSASVDIEVIQTATSIKEMNFNNSSLVLPKSNVADLLSELKIVPANVDKSNIVFESSNTSVVAITGNRFAGALKSGSATISARLNGSDTVTIMDIFVPSIGENEALKARITDTKPVILSNVTSMSIGELNSNNPTDTTDNNKYLTGLNGDLVMDFGSGASFEPDSIRILWYTRGQVVMPKSYNIQTSYDGVTWEMLYMTEDLPKDLNMPFIQDITSQRTTTQTIKEFEDVIPFRYLKFSFTEYSDQSILPRAIGIREIEVKSAPFGHELTLDLDGEKVIDIGEQKPLVAQYGGKNFPKFFYASENPDIAVVNSDGIVTGVKSGSATITAFMPDGVKTASVSVSVSNNITGIEIQDENRSLPIVNGVPKITLSAEEGYNTRKLYAEIIPSGGAADSIVWSVESGSNITVEQDGTITVNGIGNAIVKATALYTKNGQNESISSVCAVEAISQRTAVQSIWVGSSALTVRQGMTAQLNASLTGVNGGQPTDKGVIWYSANEMVATVSQSGLISAVGGGNTKVFAVSRDGLKSAEVDVTVAGMSMAAAFVPGYNLVYLDETNKTISNLNNELVAVAYAVDENEQLNPNMKLKGALTLGVDYEFILPEGLTVTSAEVDQVTHLITFRVGGTLRDIATSDIAMGIVLKKSAMPGAESDALLVGVIKSVKVYSFTYVKTEDNSIAMESANKVKVSDNSYKVRITALTDDGKPFTGYRIKNGTYTSADYTVSTPVAGLSVSSVIGNASDNTVMITLVGSAGANITQDTRFGLDFSPGIITEHSRDMKFVFSPSSDMVDIKAASVTADNSGGIIGGGGGGGGGASAVTATPRLMETGTLEYSTIGTNEILVMPKKDILERNIESQANGTVSIDINLEQNIDTVCLEVEPDTYQKAKDSKVKFEIIAKGISVTFDPTDVEIPANSKFSIKISRTAAGTYDIKLLQGHSNFSSDQPITVKITYNTNDIKEYEKLFMEYLNTDTGSWVSVATKASINGFVVCEMEGFGRVRLTQGDAGFKDIADHWAKNEISVLGARKIINGVGINEFSPEDNVTRAELTAMIIRAIKGVNKRAMGQFNDVNENDWYYSAVNTAAEMGIVQGSQGKFDPDRYLTREEMTAMIVRTLKGMIPDEELEKTSIKFEDEDDISDWAKETVEIALGMGFVKGVSESGFEPKGLTTRAQSAAVIYRLLEYLKYF